MDYWNMIYITGIAAIAFTLIRREMKARNQQTAPVAQSWSRLEIEALGPPIGHLMGQPFYERIRLPDDRIYRFEGQITINTDGRISDPIPDCSIVLQPGHLYILEPPAEQDQNDHGQTERP